MKVRVRYSKTGKVRFTSHRDTARHWERAVRKAGVKVAMSAGFTPRPRMSFGLALPTGAESLAEYLDIDLDELPADIAEPDALCAVFDASMPPGYAATRVAERDRSVASLQDAVVSCTWRFDLVGVDRSQVEGEIGRVLGAASLPLERERKGQRSTDDVRPAIESLALAPVIAEGDGQRVGIEARLATATRGLRPLELVAVLLPSHDAVDTAARVLRTHQWIEADGVRGEVLPLDPVAGRSSSERN
ncbi:MAG: TIGR03936 family radical SAM-associated protein [Ilumatobacteraceae bacterium]